MTRTNHANCAHPKTAAARKACRKANTVAVTPIVADAADTIALLHLAAEGNDPAALLEPMMPWQYRLAAAKGGAAEMHAATRAAQVHIDRVLALAGDSPWHEVCMTCCEYAEATSANQGYSDCCNDRIMTSEDEIREVIMRDYSGPLTAHQIEEWSN